MVDTIAVNPKDWYHECQAYGGILGKLLTRARTPVITGLAAMEDADFMAESDKAANDSICVWSG